MTDFNSKNVFKTPENYFEELENKLLKNTKSSQKNHGFKTPEGYFNILEEAVIKKRVNSKSFSQRKLLLSLTSIAASLVLVLTLINNEKPEPVFEEQAINDFIESYYLQNMDSYEILSMIEDNEIESDFDK